MYETALRKLLPIFRRLLPENQPTELTRQLVAIPSINPPGEERKVIEHCAGLLEAWGFRIQLISGKEPRLNLVAKKTYGKGGKSLILNGHLDVVPVGDEKSWTFDPFSGAITQNRLYGRGAADMKGGVAAMIYGAWLVEHAQVDMGDAEIVFHLVSDEESGGFQGTRVLMENGAENAVAAVIAEPTDLHVVLAQKGTLWNRITIKGKSAHGATPHLGINAIEKMAAFIPYLKNLDLSGTHELLGSPSLNIGVIQGGDKINSVPGICSVDIDRRCLPDENPVEIERELDDLLTRFSRQKGVPCFRERLMLAEPAEVASDTDIAVIAQDCLSSLFGIERPFQGISGFTDARYYIRQAGIPAILLGPGHINQAHVVDEFVDITQLKNAAIVYALMIAALFGRI